MTLGNDAISKLSRAARDHFARIPSIALMTNNASTPQGATVVFHTATYGINTPGTVYRMDGVPIPLRPAMASTCRSIPRSFRDIEGRIRALTGSDERWTGLNRVTALETAGSGMVAVQQPICLLTAKVVRESTRGTARVRGFVGRNQPVSRLGKRLPVQRRSGEWECEYERWGNLYNAVLNYVAYVPLEDWPDEVLQAVLYAVARDNEIQHLPVRSAFGTQLKLVALARAALTQGETDAKWQLAEEHGHLGHEIGEAEQLLWTLVHDEHEYVRRRALGALARMGSPSVEQLALEAWHRPDEHQEWARMMALSCLYRIGSSQLGQLLAEAERDQRLYLRDYAKRVRRGDIDDAPREHQTFLQP